MSTQPYRRRRRRARPLGATLRAMRKGKASIGPNRGALNRLSTRRKRKRVPRVPQP